MYGESYWEPRDLQSSPDIKEINAQRSPRYVTSSPKCPSSRASCWTSMRRQGEGEGEKHNTAETRLYSLLQSQGSPSAYIVVKARGDLLRQLYDGFTIAPRGFHVRIKTKRSKVTAPAFCSASMLITRAGYESTTIYPRSFPSRRTLDPAPSLDNN